ncbi:hypothetical protein GCM10011611_59090 [Aliidongia dinghuensis]|uniref:Uncharacterized protein n=1 Tax=Aliidongia dinghuensis TaxID=1867774 RepID=A0A8J3E6U6_9PROT|nr:hypothetical protein [Aliidongia dinghuensis]GGF44868.1 hypothetical protein GCM10011611_59090 [Aliidongia dinghuensis]
MTTPAALLAYYGTDEPPAEPRLLAAGLLSAKLIDGNLRDIRYGGREILRAIAYVVRDEDWGTYRPVIEALEIDERPDAFAVRYRARCESPSGARLSYRTSIAGRADGSLVFEVEATPLTDFPTNRCGFTVLHPIVGLAGTPVAVEHVDGTVTDGMLPDLIDPAQPFKEIRAITHQAGTGLTATCRMEGDVFEMEDQRNWSDASYKTYVRPLALPWPYVLPAAGVAETQRVSLEIAAPAPVEVRRSDERPVALSLGAPEGAMPCIGLVLTPEETAPTLAASEHLAAIAPQTLLCHFDPTAGHGAAALAGFAAVAQAHAGEIVLECVLPCRMAPAEELANIAALVDTAGLRLDAIAVSPAVDRQSTPPGSRWPACPPLAEIYQAARAAFPGLRLGGGTFAYFTELNRKRPPVELVDFVTHCTCPIVHAADDESVMQSLEALPFITRSVRAIAGAGKPYRVGPSTIAMRHNPYGSRTMPNPDRRRVAMADADPRQSGLFGAAWLVGYAARMAAAGVEALTLGSLTGPRGLLQGDGNVVPAFHVARDLASLASCRYVPCRSDREDEVLAFAARSAPGETTLLIANLTAAQRRIELPATVDRPWTVAMLDETGSTPTTSSTGTLVLKPFAVARLDQP